MNYLTFQPQKNLLFLISCKKTDGCIVFVRCILCVVACFFLFSCATKPPAVASDPVSFFSLFLPPGLDFTDSTDVFALIPVDGNEELVRAIVRPYLPNKSADELINRTKTIYAAVSPQAASFKIVAQGKFPRSIIPFVFTRSSGWTKKLSDSQNLTVPFKTYFEAQTGAKTFVQTAIPYSGLALAASSGIQSMLERAALNQPSPPVNDRISALCAQASKTEIFFYIPSPAHFLKTFLGDSFTLPFSFLAGTCMPVYENDVLVCYTANIYVKLRDSRFVRPAVVLLNNALPLSGSRIVAGTDSDITIENVQLDISVISLFFPD